MTTIFFYSFILFSSTFFVWLSEKGRHTIDRWILLSIAFLLVFIPSAVRYDIGTDYLNYMEIFESGNYINYKIKEPAFYFVNWFLDSIGAHVQWLFVSFAFIFTAVTFKAYLRKNAWLLHFIFFSMLWFFSFNGTRQAIALSCCFLGLFYFFDKRYTYFVMLAILGALFHQSALVVIFLGVLALIPLSTCFKSHIAPLMFIAILGVAFFSINIVLSYIEQILNLLGMTKYSSYFNSTKHFVERDFGSGLGALVKVFFSIYIIINCKNYLQQKKQYWLLIILVFFYALGVILANKIIIFSRMADIFVIAQILGVYFLWELPLNKSINRFIVLVYVVFLILSFVKMSVGLETNYANPKINPYQTIIQ